MLATVLRHHRVGGSSLCRNRPDTAGPALCSTCGLANQALSAAADMIAGLQLRAASKTRPVSEPGAADKAMALLDLWKGLQRSVLISSR